MSRSSSARLGILKPETGRSRTRKTGPAPNPLDAQSSPGIPSSWTFRYIADCQSMLQHPLFLDALQAPLFKKSISSTCWPILRSNSAMRPSDYRCFPFPRNTLPGAWRNRQRRGTLGFTSKHRYLAQRDPCSSRWTTASLNSLVNVLLDNP